MRTWKTTVILISGAAGAGKTTLADILFKKLQDFAELRSIRYSFAQPLKYIAQAYLGWDKNKDEKGRKLLQDLGRIGREYKGDIWVTHFFNYLDRNVGDNSPFNFVVIDDWRYPNERVVIEKNPMMDVVTIRVGGRTSILDGELAQDTSETSLPEMTTEDLDYTGGNVMYNLEVNNDDTVESLAQKADEILEQIKFRYIVD